jgi:predicted Zn-dependent protease
MAGFEAVTAAGIPDAIAASAEELLRLASLPTRPFEDSGRFPVVFDGDAVAMMLGGTLGQALDGDRVTGLEADAAGGSIMSRAGMATLSPLVTVSVDRDVPAYTAAQWDDEGVVPQKTTLIERGQTRAVMTTRETAAALETSAGSSGAATVLHPGQMVMSGGASLTLVPSATRADLDTLTRQITHGIVCYGGACLPEPNLSSGLFRGGRLIEVRAGRPVAHVRNLTFQFQTRRWWSAQLRALGDATTARTRLVTTQKGMPWQSVTQVATTPAALVVDVDVVRTDVQPL